MRKLCACFALILILLLFPVTVLAGDGYGEKNVKIIGPDGDDRSDGNIDRTKDDTPHSSIDNKINEDNDEKATKKVTKEDEEGLLKSLRATFKGALDDFVKGVIHQMMAGSVTIFEAEAEVNESENTESISYTLNTDPIDPFAPTFVRKIQLPTGGFYIVGIIFTILGSGLIRLIYEKYPVQFSEFREALTGEEKPYNNESIVTASVIAMVLWVAYIILVKVIVGFRNLIIDSAGSTGVVIPDTYASNMPTFMLTALASYSTAFQSATGEYGIYVFNSLLFIAGLVSEFLLLLGASGTFWKFNIIYWGIFAIFCIIDIIIVGAISIGVSLYLMEGNPIYVTVGLVFSCVGIIILGLLVVSYAIWKCRKISIG